MQECNITENDIKTLKYEKRMGYIFATPFFAFGILFSVVLFATTHETNWTLFFLVNLSTFPLGYLIAFFRNRKINKDLRTGTKMVTIGKITRKEHQIDYEVGSGSLGQEMKAYSKYVLTVNGIEYNVEKELFDTVEEVDFIEVHEAKYSEVLLGLAEHKTDLL